MPEPSDLMAMLIFSVIGIIAFRSGKREMRLPPIIIGLLLMLYPYFIPKGPWWLWGTGVGLTGALYFFREGS